MDATHNLNGRFYQNPVLGSSFADPFVLKHAGAYWGYSTGFWRDGRVFGVAYSPDLVNWQLLDGAMAPLPGGHTCYWAPEVIYDNGKFLLYYSVGNETLMHIRVAVADHPAGSFVDSGHTLTREEFAIDAHVFIDDDGSRYLFYATDFLKHTHIGTGTVVDRMVDPFTLAGQARPVTRARYDWQVYDPNRASKGGVRWHTVEGPAVLKRKGRYYQMLSGGNWQNTTYGVSFATTTDIHTPDEWEQWSDGTRVLPILRTLPGQVVGPGHNSVVRGPDNQQLFCVYHRWSADGGARVMCIDRLDWVGERMTVLGPSTGLEVAPNGPTAIDLFAESRDGLGKLWQTRGGAWATHDGVAVQSGFEGTAEAHCQVQASHFIAEVNIRLADGENGRVGIALAGEAGTQLRAMIDPSRRALAVTHEREELISLPPEFNVAAFHCVRVEVNGQSIRIKIDEGPVQWRGTLAEAARQIALVTDNARGDFAGFALTAGWEDLFEERLEITGWQSQSGAWMVADGELQQDNEQLEAALLVKGPPLASYELVVNARLLGGAGGYGFFPAWSEANADAPLRLERGADRWQLRVGEAQAFELPPEFDPSVWQMFRFRKQGGRLTIHWEAQELGTAACTEEPTRVALWTGRARAAFEMVRVTAI